MRQDGLGQFLRRTGIGLERGGIDGQQLVDKVTQRRVDDPSQLIATARGVGEHQGAEKLRVSPSADRLSQRERLL